MLWCFIVLFTLVKGCGYTQMNSLSTDLPPFIFKFKIRNPLRCIQVKIKLLLQVKVYGFTNPVLSLFPSFSLPDVLCDPTNLIRREGTPFEAMTDRTSPSSVGLLAEVFLGFSSVVRQMPGDLSTDLGIISLSSLSLVTNVTDMTIGASGLWTGPTGTTWHETFLAAIYGSMNTHKKKERERGRSMLC